VGVTFLEDVDIKLFDSAVILTCVTAFLYSASTAFTHGYFAVLELDSDILDRNFHQILYHGMILNIWTILFIPLIVAAMVTVHSMWKIAFSDYLYKSFKNGRNIVRLRKKFHLSIKKKRKIVNTYEVRYQKAWSAFVASLFFISGMAIFENRGKLEAEAILQRVKDGTINTVIVLANGTNKKLAYLYCGARNCAAYSAKTNEIVYFPQNGHSYIRQSKM